MTNKPSSLIIPPSDPVQDEQPSIRAREPYNCTMCRHFEPGHEGPLIGACLRYPPVVHVIGMASGALAHQMQPITHQFVPRADASWICGEFAAKKGDLQ